MATSSNTKPPITLLNLPPEILEKILSFLKFEEISNVRLVCTMFDNICQELLNQGFSNAERLHAIIYKEIKSKLPRRESERRNHCLARHMDILAALEMRLSLLAMTYIKYMETGVFCFIPGKVLDEIYQILHRISNDPTPPRPHELLTELRDISSMAMEHFEEKIVPAMKNRMKNGEAEMSQGQGEHNGNPPDQQLSSSRVQMEENSYRHVVNSRVPSLRVELMQLRNSMRSTSSTVVCLRKEVSDYKAVIADQHKKMLEQDKKIICLSQMVTEMKKKISDQEKMLYDLRNSVLYLEQKFNLHQDCTSSGNVVIQMKEECDNVKDSNMTSSDDYIVNTNNFLYSRGIPSPDSIDPDSADLKTLLTVLDNETLLLPVTSAGRKRKNSDDENDCVTSSYRIDETSPAKKHR